MPLPCFGTRVVTSAYVIVAALSTGGCDGERADRSTTSTDAAVREAPHLLATSETHSCALRNSGLYCWGLNFSGQLGNIRTEDSTLPVLAPFAGPDIVQLALAAGRTCVLRRSGSVECWGDNDRGQLGDGTRANSYTPIAALGIHDATAVAVDEGSACVARAADAGVACWGNAPLEQPTEGSLVPVAVLGVSAPVEIRAGALGSYCAREATGLVKCWRFAEGKWTAASEVPELAGARSIAMTYSGAVCALTPSSDIQCHSFDNNTTETVPESQGSVAMASTGGLTVCAADPTATWRCWPIVHEIQYSVLKVHSSFTIAELVMTGLRICALGQDTSVGCLRSEDLTAAPTTDFPDLLPVPLPP
jgi:hypothetical protein